MGYMHIDNLYKDQNVLAFKKCYALEKIHGTSAHIKYSNGELSFYSGGAAHANFVKLFDAGELAKKFGEKFTPSETVTIFGEAYGGGQQKMSKTYGPNLRFIAFDVQIGDETGSSWLSVPKAADFVLNYGIEFVDFALIDTDLASIDAERDKPSTQARRNGIEEDKIREGVVLRPPFEVTLNNGKRVLSKHKGEAFSERGTPNLADLDPTKRVILEQAEAIAFEWVTPTRLEHVIDQIVAARGGGVKLELQDIPIVISTMWDDIERESAGEVVSLKPAKKAISGRTVMTFKRYLADQIREAVNG